MEAAGGFAATWSADEAEVFKYALFVHNDQDKIVSAGQYRPGRQIC